MNTANRFACMGLAALALTLSPAGTSPARGQSLGTFTFDSGSCREDTDEALYVTLYGTVFRLPMDRLHHIRAVPPSWEQYVPAPADPDEPLGCPENPLPGTAFFITVPAPEGMTFPSPQGLGIRFADGIIPVSRLAIRAAQPDFFGMQISHQSAAERHCEDGVVRMINPRLRECLIEPIDQVPRERWAGSYVTDASDYSVPFGGPFVVSCIPSIQIRSCSVSYKMYETVNLTYDVDLRLIQPIQVVLVDQHIRQLLEVWRVPSVNLHDR